MVSPAGFEPTAPGLGILCSIRLSYGDFACPFSILHLIHAPAPMAKSGPGAPPAYQDPRETPGVITGTGPLYHPTCRPRKPPRCPGESHVWPADALIAVALSRRRGQSRQTHHCASLAAVRRSGGKDSSPTSVLPDVGSGAVAARVFWLRPTTPGVLPRPPRPTFASHFGRKRRGPVLRAAV